MCMRMKPSVHLILDTEEVSVCTTSCNIKSSTFCLSSVYMWFILLQKNNNYFQNSINRLTVLIQTDCVLCSVLCVLSDVEAKFGVRVKYRCISLLKGLKKSKLMS
jgi:hypothetical protein